MQKYSSRKDVPEKYKWNLKDFFKSEKEFEESLDRCKKLVKDLKNYVGCTKDAHKLYEFLNKEIEAIALWEDLYVYAYLINDQELGNEKSIKRKNKAEQLNLELEINNCKTLNKTINLFFTEEYMSNEDKIYCSKCYKYFEGQRIKKMKNLPKILIIVLKDYYTTKI